MAVFTKTKVRHARPRCEAKTATGQRCNNRGTLYRDDMAVCSIHAAMPAVRHFKELK